MKNKVGFSQKHPFIFGFSLIVAAVVLVAVTMAAFQFLTKGEEGVSLTGPDAGIVNIEGTISSSGSVVRWINKLSRKDDIQGIIVRINSPGGLVAPSQEIYRALERISKKKPVVVSMAQVAASGGYYIACAADKIVANPGTITGSIGVKAKLANVKELMKKIGVKQKTITSGDLKNAGSITDSLTPEERKYFQSLVENLFEQFRSVVLQNRDLKKKQMRKLSDGRAVTGQQARELGLVDILGGMQAAKKELKEMTNLSGKIDFLRGPKKEKSLLEWIIGIQSLNKVLQLRKKLGNRWYFKY